MDIGEPKQREIEFKKVGEEEFKRLAEKKLGQLERAFEDYKSQEPRVSDVDRYVEIDSDNQILSVVIDDVGVYVFRANQESELIYAVSPLSGVMKYFYLQDQKRWCSNKDEHLLDELLMRDLMTVCKGYLML